MLYYPLNDVKVRPLSAVRCNLRVSDRTYLESLCHQIVYISLARILFIFARVD